MPARAVCLFSIGRSPVVKVLFIPAAEPPTTILERSEYNLFIQPACAAGHNLRRLWRRHPPLNLLNRPA